MNLKSISVMALAAASVFASAQVFTLTDGGVSATGDLSSSNSLNALVAFGLDHMYQLSHYISVNGSGPVALATFDSTPVVTTTGSNIIDAVYSDGAISVSLRLLLSASDPTGILSNQFILQNWGNTEATVSLFEYWDLDIDDTAGGDTSTRVSASTFESWGDLGSYFSSQSTPGAHRSEVGPFPSIFSSIAGGSLDTPFGAGINQSVTGDSTYAFQWTSTLAAAGGSFSAQSDTVFEAVPEPATMALVGLGALAALRRRRAR